jgi:hypothetical protein
VTEGNIVKALANHHSGSEWAFLAQVRNQTGFERNTRTADAIAFSLWPSRGLYATGYEVKVTRQDLRKELADPRKAEEIARFCKLWFIAAPEGICRPEDLPLPWGLVEVKEAGRLKWTKPAVPNEHAMEPTWRFVCAVMRSASEASVPAITFQEQLETAKTEIEKKAKENEGYELKRARENLEKANHRIAAFESKSGVKLDRYSDYFAEEIGDAVALLRQMNNSTPMHQLLELKGHAEKIARDIDVFAAAFNAIREA